MSPLEIAFGIAVIGALVLFAARKKEVKEIKEVTPQAAYKVEPPVVEEVKLEVAPAAPVITPAPKKPRAKKASAEKSAAPAKQPVKSKTTQAKAPAPAKPTKAAAKKSKIRVVK